MREEGCATVITLSLEPERIRMFGRPSLRLLSFASDLPSSFPSAVPGSNYDVDFLVVVACKL